MMHNMLIAIVLFVAVISGTSKLLLVIAGIFIILLTTCRLLQSKFTFHIHHVSAASASLFLALLALTILPMPLENLPKFGMTLSSSLLAVLLIGNICKKSANTQVRIYSFVLSLIVFGDLIHLSGVLGSDMNAYKSLVQFDELSNLERESDVGFLGLRYHGWFAEPSYHGAFTGLLCALIWNNGVRWKVFFVGITLFVFCPTPMMVLAFGVGILMAMRNWGFWVVSHPFATAATVGIAGLAVSFLFASRVVALSVGAVDAIGGESVNSSEAIRLIYPVIALLSHVASFGLLPESSGCIERTTCLPESLKLPLITIFIFFGMSGLISIVLFIKWLYRSTLMRVFVAITIASILSGGGAYVLQFGLVAALLLNMPAHHRETPFAAKMPRNTN